MSYFSTTIKGPDKEFESKYGMTNEDNYDYIIELIYK